jgi:hypothetical protein
MVATMTNVLLAGFGTDRLHCEEAMKTASRENPERWVATPGNRVVLVVTMSANG